MTTVRVRHLRAADLCMKGAREWFARHGFPWSDFVASGIAADRLLATGDKLAQDVVTIAERDHGR